MNIELQMRPGSSVAKLSLSEGEHFTSEGGAMIAMTNNMSIETNTYKKSGGGSLLKGIKRMFSGESFFVNHYTAGSGGGEVYLAPTLPGDMMIKELNNQKLIVQSGSYLASEPNVNVDFNWQGLKSMFSGEGLFWLGLTGQGQVILNSFGAIYPIEVNGSYIVDTGHIVAFEESLKFKISKAGKSWISSILGGEGLVCKFEGTGTVWCQSHNPNSFGGSLGPNLRPM